MAKSIGDWIKKGRPDPDGDPDGGHDAGGEQEERPKKKRGLFGFLKK